MVMGPRGADVAHCASHIPGQEQLTMLMAMMIPMVMFDDGQKDDDHDNDDNNENDDACHDYDIDGKHDDEEDNDLRRLQ